jgi:hypothetical protein
MRRSCGDGAGKSQGTLSQQRGQDVDIRRRHYALLASLLAVTLGTIRVPRKEGEAAAAKVPTFVGSAKCKECHDKIYATWRQTVHPKAIQEVTENPQAIQGDWTQPFELRTFTKADVKFTHGVHQNQVGGEG